MFVCAELLQNDMMPIPFSRCYVTSVLLGIRLLSFFVFLFFPAFRSSETGARGENLSSPEASKHR